MNSNVQTSQICDKAVDSKGFFKNKELKNCCSRLGGSTHCLCPSFVASPKESKPAKFYNPFKNYKIPRDRLEVYYELII